MNKLLTPRALKFIFMSFGVLALSALVALYSDTADKMQGNIFQSMPDKRAEVADLTVTAVTTSQGIDLSWVEVGGADSYQLDRAYAENELTTVQDSSKRDYLDTTFADKQDYHYQVTALAGDEVLAKSNVIDVHYDSNKLTATTEEKAAEKAATAAVATGTPDYNEVPTGEMGLVAAEKITPQILKVHFSRAISMPKSTEAAQKLITVSGATVNAVQTDATDTQGKTILVFVDNLGSDDHIVTAGSTVRDLLSQEIAEGYDQVAVKSSAASTSTTAAKTGKEKADFNGDGKVDFDDFSMLANNYKQ